MEQTQHLETAEAIIKQFVAYRRITDVKGLKTSFTALMGREIQSVSCGSCVDRELRLLMDRVKQLRAAEPVVQDEVSQRVTLPKQRRKQK